MHRVEPSYPDLLPVSHRLGGVPLPETGVALDPVTMRLLRQPLRPAAAGDAHPPRRPQRVLVHAAVAASRQRALARLLEAGCGVVLLLDSPLSPEDLPAPLDSQQVTVLNVYLSPFWGQVPFLSLESFRRAGFAVGSLLALAAQLPLRAAMEQAVGAAKEAGAQFVVFAPLFLSGEEKHQAYERAAGPDGHSQLEDLLFHTEPGEVAKTLEVHGSLVARRAQLREGLLGPGTSACQASCFAAACSLLLWARRMDLLDGVASQGWRLRRAAQALLVSGRDPWQLMEEDNLRLVPGFDAWVEAFARTLWAQEGEPFSGLWMRWVELAAEEG